MSKAHLLPLSRQFELEQLESRVLLSADILPAAAAMASAAQHQNSSHGLQAIEHRVAAPHSQTSTQVTYNPADHVGGIFEGMTGESLTSSGGAAEQTSAPAAQAATEFSATQTSTSASTTSSTRATTRTVAAAEAAPTVSATATATAATTTATTSTASTTGSTGSTMTEQLTTTLKAANAPPAANKAIKPLVSTTNLEQYILDSLSGATSPYTGTLPLDSAKLAGFLDLTGVSLVFNATKDKDGNWTGSVAITATSGTLYAGQNFSASVGAITGTYYISASGNKVAHAFSLTAANLSLQIGEALKITSSSIAVDYVGGGAASQQIAVVTGATVSSPKFPTIPTATLTNFKLRNDGFSFDNFTLTASSISLGTYFSASNVSLKITGGLDKNNNPLPFNLNFASPKDSTAGIEFSADNIQLFSNVKFLNLQFASVQGSFELIKNVTVPAAATIIGSGVLSISLSGVNISVGEAFTIHMGNITLQPGQDTLGSVTDATITSNLVTGIPTFNLGLFNITKHGFALGDISMPLVGDAEIGTFLTLHTPTLHIASFTLVDGAITGSVALTFTGIDLFPGNTNFTASFTGLAATFDLGGISKFGKLTFSATTFSMTIADLVTITASGITITPDQTTIISIDSAKIKFSLLNNLTGDITGLTIQNNGFSIASATFTADSIPTLGGILTFDNAPTVTLTDLNYTAGGTFGGVVTLDPTTVSLNVGNATMSGTFSGDYNLKTGVLNAALETFSLSLPGFVSITGDSLVLAYTPATDNSATFFLGGKGITILLGSSSGGNSVGVQISDATLALAVYKPSTGTTTYALDASGGLSLVGLPANTLSFSASNIEVRFSNHGETDEVIALSTTPDDTKHLFFTGNEQSLMATNLTLTVGTLVTVTGNFGFQSFTDPNTGLTDVAIAASDVKAVLGTDTANLTIVGASLALIVRPATAGGQTTYALVAKGGTDTLNGVPGVSLSASGLVVRVNTTGLDPEDLASLPTSLATPDGPLAMDFAGLGSENVIAVQGHITLNILGFIALEGDFGFQTFTDTNGKHDIIFGAQHIYATLGTATTNLSIEDASLYAIVVAGDATNPSTYALVVKGGTEKLNGVDGLMLSASGLEVVVNNTGVDPTTLGAPTSLPTPGGDLTTDFTGIGATNIKSVIGDLTLTIANFITLQGSFGFQAYKDSTTGLTNIAIGATHITATLGTATANLKIEEASLGVVIVASAGGPSKYALVANGGTDTLNGIPGLTLTASGLVVKINKLGADPSALPGVPTSVHTSGGDVALDFTGLGAGALIDVEGTISMSILDFVTLEGSFVFQTFTDLVSGKTDLAIAATGVKVTMAVGGVTLKIEEASLGLIILPGAVSGQSTYALVVNGGTDELTGVPGLTLSASGLSVRVNNTGTDLTTRIGTTTLTTPGGDVDMDFSDLGTANVKSVVGHVTLSIAGFVSLEGDFGFQQFTDTGTNTKEILVGAKNVNAVLGTADTNLTITGASFGLLLLPGTVGNPGKYALMANGGVDVLNGVNGLSLSASGLSVKVNNGVSAALLTGAGATAIHTSDGDVVMDFTGLGAGNVMAVQGSITLNVAGFVSLSGSFSFTKKTSPTDANVTEIVVGATQVSAFIGTPDKSVGVAIDGAELGLVVYKNTVTATTTYALYASAPVSIVGLPTDIRFSGTMGVAINNTGAKVEETVVTPGGNVDIHFTDGTGGTQDQRNIQSFGGHLTMSIGPVASPLFSLTGDFSFTKVVSGGLTQIQIAAANVGTSNLIPDNNGGASVTISGGTLGLILFTKVSGATTVNAGYALTASATAAASGGSSSASLTVTIRRNTTTSAVNQTVTAGGQTIPVKFLANEVATGTTAFQSISLSNASLNIDNTIIIVAGGGNTTTGTGFTTKALTGITLTLQDPDSGTILFSLTADSASYTTITAGTTFGGMKWVNGGKDVLLNNISLTLGGYVVFTGTVDIRRYTDATNAVVTSFKFTGATIAFYVNSNPMASLTGDFAFAYSSATGFAMTGAPVVTDFSFMGESLGGGTAQTLGTGALPPPPAPHKIGPVEFGTPSISLGGFSLKLDGTLSAKVTISDTLAKINGGAITATATNLAGSFDIGLKLNLADPFSAPTNITASGFTLKIGHLDITIGVSASISLVLSANNVFIDPTAGATQNLVSFGGNTAAPGLSVALNVGTLKIEGGASNFAIHGDGSFVALNNFSVTLTLGNNSSDSLKWPSWLPIQNVSISLVWAGDNFNSDPSNFQIDLSADINLAQLKGIPLSIVGTVSHVVIDIGKLQAGEFPIVSIGALGVTVSGNLFGGTVSGSLIAGIARFDSNGALVDNNGKLLSNGTPGVGTIQSVFYGAIDASFTMGGMSGFQIRIGLSQYGPLSVYFAMSTPTGIILDPQSGLAINNFRGGVKFGVGLPTVTISDPIAATDALQLRLPGFQTPATLTLSQWQAELAKQVATLYKDGNTTDGWSNLGNSTITISAGATLFDAYVSQNAFKADVDIIFDTTGKFIILGTATFGNSLSIGIKIYADLAPVISGTTATTPVNILFLIDFPAQTGTPISPPILSIYGVIQFKFTRLDGTTVTATNQADAFQIDIAGRADLNVMGGFQASLTGNISMTFSATSFQMSIKDVSLDASYVGNLGTAAGELTIQRDGDTLNIWGAFLLAPNFTALESVGIHAGGQIYFQINTTTEVKPVTLHLTTGDVGPINLKPHSFSLLITGTATFDLQGTQVFSLSGTLAIDLNITPAPTPTFTLTIFVSAQLKLGPANSTLFIFNATGLIYVDQDGFAAKMTLQYGSSPLSGFSIGVNWLLVMNTTGKTITYEIPTPLPTSPPSPPVATVVGPDFASANVLATVSYETIVGGKRTLVIPDGAPPSGTTNYATWTATSASAYFILLGRGNLTIGSLTISGTINLIASYSQVTGLSFAFSANAKLNLTVNGSTLFSFNVVGGIQISSAGLVAALQISLSTGFSMPSSLGFTLTATFRLQVNTTSSAVTVAGTSITVQPGAVVAAIGSLSIPGFSISGEFDLSVSSTSISVFVNGTVTVIGVTLTVTGYAGVYYDTDPGFALSLTLSVGTGGSTDSTLYPVSALGNKFVIQGTLTLQINTCSKTRMFTNPVTSATTSILSGFVISVSNLRVFLFGLNLTGSASFGITSAGLNIKLDLTLNFFGLCTFNLNGYVNANGTFSLTASASFNKNWSVGIFSGNVWAYVTITISNNGFSASVGCGVHVDGIGSLSVSGSITITSSKFILTVGVDIGICDVTVTLELGSVSEPPAPPPQPVLGFVSGGVLTLYFGQDVASRGASFGALAAENYSLTNPTGVAGTVVVSALGYTQTFLGVNSILVNNTLTGNDTITLTNQVIAPLTITLGNGNNNITGGGAAVTVYDYGTGSNTVTAGSGGGTYYGGLAGGVAYGSKAETVINGNIHVIQSGYASYTLTPTQLQYGSFLLTLSGVTNVALNAVAGNAAHSFTLLGWFGTTTLVGAGTNNTINVNPLGGTQAATFVLTNALLTVTMGTSTATINLSGIQTANLTGNNKGANTYTVSGWSGGGSLTGPSGSTNTVIAVNDVNFSLTNTTLDRSGLPTLTLSGIQTAMLTSGAGVNIFTVSGWSGTATLTGVAGNDTFNITLTGVGTGTITVTDATVNSNDILNLSTSATTTITATQLKVIAQLVNYSGIKTLNVNGAVAGLTYNVQATNVGTTTTITTFGAGNTINIGSTAGNTPATAGNLSGIAGALVLVGGGSDVLNLDDSGNLLTGRTGTMTPTTINFTGLALITYGGISAITINLGQAADLFTIIDTITSASVTPVVVVNGNGGNDTFIVTDDHAVTTINGGAGNDLVAVLDDHAVTLVNGDAGDDTFNALDNHAVTTMNGGDDNDTFWTFATDATLNLNGNGGNDTVNVMASVVSGAYRVNAPVRIDGGAGTTDQVNIYGTVLNDSVTIDGLTFTNLGLNLAYSNITNLAVLGLGGDDTFYVVSVAVTTALDGDGAIPAFTLPAGVTAPDLTGGLTANSSNDTFYIGWRGAGVAGSLADIAAAVTITGNTGTDFALVDDSADTADRTFTLTPGHLTSTAMGANGAVNYDATLETLNITFGSGNDTFNIVDITSETVTTIDGGAGNDHADLNFTGDFSATSLTLVNFETASLNVVGNFTGTLTSEATFTTVHIGGSLTSTGVFNAGAIGDMTVGGDLAGLLNVTGLLDVLSIGGGSPGKIVAGSINFIKVQAGYGNKVLQVIEGGIERKIQADPTTGGAMPGTIHYAFIYDSSAVGDPQLALRITNSGSAPARSFNLALTTSDSTTQFNLALIVATARTGLANLTVYGDLLYTANAAERDFLGFSPTARSGVVLPFDNITGVSVSGILPIGMVNVAGIEGVAFGSLRDAKGNVVNILGDLGSTSNPQVLWNLLGSKAKLLAGSDTFQVAFSEKYNVKVFAQVNTNATLEYVMTLADQVNDGASITAQIKIHPATTPNITSIQIAGDGASVSSRYGVSTITSTGALGDVTLTGGSLVNVTSAAIFGNINVNNGAITGTIQTTGVRIDPITGDETTVSANIGGFTYDKLGNIAGVTVIYAKNGITSTGQIVSRGDLISTVKGSVMAGRIAAQGNIGAILTNDDGTAKTPASGKLTRFGGLNISGAISGQVVALGNIFGDIKAGSLSGRIAAAGQTVLGLADSRTGILGDIRITNSFTATGVVISGGTIGDVANGTAFYAATAKGFVAANGAIKLSRAQLIPAARQFANVAGTANGDVLGAIFTDGGTTLTFDTGGTLQGLNAIVADLKAIRISSGALAGTTP